MRRQLRDPSNFDTAASVSWGWTRRPTEGHGARPQGEPRGRDGASARRVRERHLISPAAPAADPLARDTNELTRSRWGYHQFVEGRRDAP